MKKYQLSFQKNIRDLGGLTGYEGHHIKYGKLFRGGALIKVQEEDIPIIESFHLTDVVDFRTSVEFEYRPDYRIEGVKYHNLSALKEEEEHKGNKEVQLNEDGNLLWFIKKGDTGFDHLRKTYDHFVTTEEGIKAFKDFFSILLSSDDLVVYFHCSQGKDRAGFAAYLIETALGVSYEDAMEDYLLSNEAMESRVQRLIASVEDKSFYNEEYHQSLLDVFSAKKEYLDSVIRKMVELYGSTMNFITNILEVDVDRLRKIYLD